MVKAGIGRWNDNRETVDVGGVGMDMGFAAVHELSRLMFPDGFGCIGEGCPSNDHSNGDRDYAPHVQMKPEWDHKRKEFTDKLAPTVSGADHWHNKGGYALKHRWLT